ncbi:MAG: phage protease [Rhizobiaceae bacterium]|nr:phage protease [Rhizobiaceae bacterium]
MLTAAFLHAHALQSFSAGEAGQWAELLPIGAVNGVDGRKFKATNGMAIIARSFEWAANTAGQIPVDYNHAIDVAAPKGEPSPAAGWISRMEVRDGSIWGLIEWTPRASQHVAEREYRFLSPVIRHNLNREVLSIERASLTNNPNLTLKALNAAGSNTLMDTEQFLADLRKALGLEEDADFAAILKAVDGLAGREMNSVDPARYVPIETFEATLAELNRVNAGVSLNAAEQAVEKAMDEMKLLPFMRDWAIELCTANKPAFDGFIERMGKPMATMFGPSGVAERGREIDRKLHGGSAGEDEIYRNMRLTREDVDRYGNKEQN